MFIVKVENQSQLNLVLESPYVDTIILARDSFPENDIVKNVDLIKRKNKNAFVLLERISRYEEIKNLRVSTDNIFAIQNLDGIIVQNLDQFAYVLRKINTFKNEKLIVELNYTMNCYNELTKNLYSDIYSAKRENHKDVPLRFTAPVELNIHEIENIDTMLIYGYIDVMISANCLRKNTAKIDGKEPICTHRFDFDKVENYSSFVKDRKNKELHYKTYCKYCYNKIFNVEPLYLLDIIDSIDQSIFRNEKKYRLDFSFENEKEVEKILNDIKLLSKSYSKNNLTMPKTFTRGHFKNSII